MKIRLASVFAFLLIAFPLLSDAQTSTLDDRLESIMQKHQLTGLALAYVKKGKIHYSKAMGYRDLEKKEFLEETDIFRIASISKSFTATALMQLVEQKKISLDDDFSRLVGFTVRNPKYPDLPITLRMVLSHRSSINDSQGYFSFDEINPETNKDFAKCYNDYAPGTKYQYCNLNYNMAGAVLERISGERFDDYIEKYILRPLGLYGGYNVDSLDAERFVTLYNFDSATARFIPSPAAYASRKKEIENYKIGYTTPVFSPTGGMKLSARDLATYMMMHMNKGKYSGGRIISKKSSGKMQEPYTRGADYGLALTQSTEHIASEQLTGHTGSAYGLFSAMFFHPKKKYGVVVMISGGNPAPGASMRTPIQELMTLLHQHYQ